MINYFPETGGGRCRCRRLYAPHWLHTSFFRGSFDGILRHPLMVELVLGKQCRNTQVLHNEGHFQEAGPCHDGYRETHRVDTYDPPSEGRLS